MSLKSTTGSFEWGNLLALEKLPPDLILVIFVATNEICFAFYSSDLWSMRFG